MKKLSDETVKKLTPIDSYLGQRKNLVDWLSGVGDSLHISNQAIHHAVLILDLYASKLKKEFDVWIAALCALLVSAKFVQMKYPSADSLNSATDNAYSYEKIVAMEAKLLSVIDWDLMQYPTFEYLNFFLAQGCFFSTDSVLLKDGGTQFVSSSHASNFRKYAEFFSDFCVQESDLLQVEADVLSAAIIAFTRKHLNLQVIWTNEIEKLTLCSWSKISNIYAKIEQKYAESFPDHARNQSRLVNGR